MMIVRGVNVFPSAVATVLNGFSELSGEFRIVLPEPGPLDRLPVEAELAPGEQASERLVATIEATIRDRTGASAQVVLLPTGTLPRTEGKTKRIVRRPRS
jgi:phenylacetate-CoA ligase